MKWQYQFKRDIQRANKTLSNECDRVEPQLKKMGIGPEPFFSASQQADFMDAVEWIIILNAAHFVAYVNTPQGFLNLNSLHQVGAANNVTVTNTSSGAAEKVPLLTPQEVGNLPAWEILWQF